MSLIEAVGDDGLADIVQGMVTAAKGGDVGASKLLLLYCLQLVIFRLSNLQFSLTQFQLRPLSIRPSLDGDKEFSVLRMQRWSQFQRPTFTC